MDFRGLIAAAYRLGPIAYLATVTPNGDPHTVPIHVDVHNDRFYAMAGTRDVKIRNIRRGSSVLLHYQVSEATGWDHLMIWGTARVLDSREDRRRLWSGVMSYDVNEFAPGGPDGSLDTCFLEIRPVRAVVLRRFGLGGREEWRAGMPDDAETDDDAEDEDFPQARNWPAGEATE